jgi:hypothetical protein
MGRIPAENAGGAEVYREGECSFIGAVFSNFLGLLKRYT